MVISKKNNARTIEQTFSVTYMTKAQKCHKDGIISYCNDFIVHTLRIN